MGTTRRKSKQTKKKQPQVRLRLVLSWPRVLLCVVALAILGGIYVAIPYFFTFNVEGVINTDTSPLNFHTVDVGQGDCTIVQFPDDKVLMVDTGKSSAYNAIVAYLEKLQITTIDWLVITHPDDDHYGSAGQLLANPDLTFEQLYCSPFVKNTKSYQALMTQYDFDVPDDGYSIAQNGYVMTFVTPYADDKFSNSNDASLMMTIEYYDKIFVLTGDVSSATDATFMARAGDTFTKNNNQQVILKVAHHGARTSNSDTFLQFIFNPSQLENNFAVISCGKDNSYGHPHDETIARLQDYCEAEHVLITKDVGDVVFQATAYTLTLNDLALEKANAVNGIPYSGAFIIVAVIIVRLCLLEPVKKRR